MSKNTNAFHGGLANEGYSKEEEYFYKLNKELIEDRRAQLDQARGARRNESSAAAHWMKCPKCGNLLKEQSLLGICVEECASCHGVFLDQGELATLIDAKEPHTFLNKLKRLFKSNDEVSMLF